MVAYLERAKELLREFKEYKIAQVPIKENNKVDGLARLASTSYNDITKLVLVKFLSEPSINHPGGGEVNLYLSFQVE